MQWRISGFRGLCPAAQRCLYSHERYISSSFLRSAIFHGRNDPPHSIRCFASSSKLRFATSQQRSRASDIVRDNQGDKVETPEGSTNAHQAADTGHATNKQTAQNEGLVENTGVEAATSTKEVSKAESKVRGSSRWTLANIAQNRSRLRYKVVTINGLVQSVRRHKNVVFVELSDGTTLKSLQLVLDPKLADKAIQNGCYLAASGRLTEGKSSYEVQVSNIHFVGASDPEKSPIQKKAMTVDHLREHPHMRLRLPSYALLNRVRSKAISSIWSLHGSANEDMTYVQPPIITSSDCEGAGETFTLMPRLNPAANATGQPPKSPYYFRTPKYLTVSSQLHLEAFSAGLKDVWTLSPTFRAEQSDTSRHLSEFWMYEAEYTSAPRLNALTHKVEKLIKHIVRSTTVELGTELASEFRSGDQSAKMLKDRWKVLLDSSWEYLQYTDAIDLLSKLPNLSNRPDWHDGLQLEHEKALCEHFGKPVFVLNYPKAQKPFYMFTNQTGGERDTAKCFDLLLPGYGEIAGGSVREHRLEQLISNMREAGLLKRQGATGSGEAARSDEVLEDAEEELYPYLRPGESLNTLQWYTDLRRFGTSAHAGFGLGLDRLLMYITGINNVRDIVPFPRTWGTAHC